MKITKPDDVLLLQGYHARGGRPALMVTLAYVIDADGTRMAEQDVWPWLLSHFPDEPFDSGFKKDRGVFGVAGSAFAPGGQAVKAMSVRAQVGALHKTLHVHGDRFWDHGLTGWLISPATPFASMPITLDRAFGGDACPENPYGQGHFSGSEPEQGLPLPNIELPDDPIVSLADRPAVATFSVLPAGAASRMALVGRVDHAWERERFPWLPDDTDPRWFDGVPGDQGQNTYWQGNETWSVHGMHATQTDVSGRLPGLRPRLLVRRQNGDGADVAGEAVLDLDTVWLFPNEQRVMVMYRAAVAVVREDAADIAALGVFTEHADDAPWTTAQWDQHWRDSTDADDADTLVQDVPQSAEDAQTLTQVRADHAVTVQQWKDDVLGDIQDSLDEGARQANQAIQGMQRAMPPGIDLDLPVITAPRVAALPAFPVVDRSAMTADEFKASLKADIDASLAEGEAAMETAVRDIAEQMGLDTDDLLEQVQAARQRPSQADGKTLADHIANIDMPDDIREDLLARAEEFQTTMDAMDAKLDAMFGVPVSASGAGVDDASETTTEKSESPERAATLVLTRDDVQARAAAGQSLSETVLSGLDLTGINLGAADFTGAIITDCDFSQSVLDKAIFDRANVRGCMFAQADLKASSWHASDIENTRFSGAQLEQARLTDATITACQFDAADLSHAVLDGSILGESGFDGASLVQASLAVTTFWACHGKTVDFSRGRLAGLRIDTECDFGQSSFVQADLRGSSLQNSRFVNADFNQSDLSDAFVSACDLTGTTGWRATARHTDFKNSRFHNARWPAANFFEASFDHAMLENFDLSGSNLHAVDTRTAIVRGLQVQGALLSQTRLLQDHAAGGGVS